MSLENIILAVILGVLAAIVYSLRMLVLMDRKIANMEGHLEKIAMKIVKEEYKIEKLVAKKPKKKKK